MGSNNSGGLNIDKPLLILVVGNPGSGKSFFARQFSESYKFFYIDTGRYESELEDWVRVIRRFLSLQKS
jgi:dephospho-CoA kinase